MVLATLGWVIPSSAVGGVLLPAKFAELAPDNKVALLAVATGVGAVVGLVAAVFAGSMSDQTRGRFGARNPWIVIGGVFTAALLLLQSTAQDIPSVILLWCLTVIPMNATGAGLAAIIADRVPRAKRGTLSAVAGLGLLVGSAGGPLLAAQFVSNQTLGFQVLAVLALTLPVLGVLIAPDYDNRSIPRDQARFAGVSNAFKFPRKAPDFYWALSGRFILVTGYFMVNTFQLYILTDYIGLDESDAVGVLTVNSLLFMSASLVSMAAGGWLSDRLGRRKPLILASSVLFLGAIAAPLVFPTAFGMLAFALVGGLGFGAYYSTDSALMTEVLPDADARGKDLAILNVANTGGQAVAPLISSALVVIGASFAPVFVVSLITCAIGALFILPIRSVK